MKTARSYSRKISTEEANNGYIFILKNMLSFFPPRGTRMTLSGRETERTVGVESYHCVCRGLDLPHDHYFIRWDGMGVGDTVTITRDTKIGGTYVLVIKKPAKTRK
jgi:hypothetical protein